MGLFKHWADDDWPDPQPEPTEEEKEKRRLEFIAETEKERLERKAKADKEIAEIDMLNSEVNYPALKRQGLSLALWRRRPTHPRQ